MSGLRRVVGSRTATGLNGTQRDRRACSDDRIPEVPSPAGPGPGQAVSGRRFWLVVGAVYLLAVVGFTVLGIPAPFLLAGVVAGAVCVLGTSEPRALPAPACDFALGVVGMATGSHIDSEIVGQIFAKPVAVIGSTVATLLVTLTLGQMLRVSPQVSGATATFASIAGGASGITSMAKELRADAATVVTIQYLRVLVVVFSVPIVAPLLGGGESNPAAGGPVDLLQSLLFVGVVLTAGLGMAWVWNFTASKIIFPMAVAALISVFDVFEGEQVPVPVTAIGFGLIGLMVGLDITRTTLRRVSKILPMTLGTLILGLVACAGVGLVLAHLTGISFYSAYLATTPGGLPAVMALAVTTGDDVGLVVTCQVLRVFLAISLGAVVAAGIRRREGSSPVEPGRRM